MTLELGDFSFKYRSLAVHGFGISASSNFAVLYQAMQLYFESGAPLLREDLATEALAFDRRQANGLHVAADDVYPIVHGGVVTVHTRPVTGRDSNRNGVSVRPVKHNPRWLAEHVVIAFRPQGKRHKVKNLLQKLFAHTKAKRFVLDISKQAEQAAAAIASSDLGELAESVEDYRKTFKEWTNGKYVNWVVKRLSQDLKREFSKKKILAWKPPGAGASEAIAIIVRDKRTRDDVIAYLRQRPDHWWASPLIVTSGICGEFIHSDGHRRITAGHRLDFVGAADLGQSPKIGVPGICCSCAIEPRSEIVLEGPVKNHS